LDISLDKAAESNITKLLDWQTRGKIQGGVMDESFQN